MSTSVFGDVLCVGLTVCFFEELWNKIKGVFDYSCQFGFFPDMISIFLTQIPSSSCFGTLILLSQSDTISQVFLI